MLQENQDVYTYFLGRLDVNPKKFLIYTGCAQNDDDNDEDDVEDDENGHVLMMIVMMARIMQSTKVK